MTQAHYATRTRRTRYNKTTNTNTTTPTYPETAATLEVLDLFHQLTLAGKASHWQFYLALEHLTDNTDINVPKSRYPAFVRLVREYASELMYKRAGKGHEREGIKNTGLGELAVLCFACPQSGVNLPPNWEALVSEYPYLYRLYVSLDANFRLKNRLKSSEATDPGLHTGRAYFVDQHAYKVHLRQYGAQKEVSNCSGFKTLASAESKFSIGMRYTGVGMCVCSRHELVRQSGVGDLQKGEKYCNMDFILLSALSPLKLNRLFVCYDIACQYKVNFKTRMMNMPPLMQIPASVSIDWGIPKCHCPAHKLDCQLPHSMNLKPGVGRTDGEGIERNWSSLNPLANSTKEMGPGARHDTLDFHFNHHNWRKTTAFGHTLRRKLCLASAESQRQSQMYEEYVDNLPTEDLEKQWIQVVEAWELDPTKENPYIYERSTPRLTLQALKLELLEEERKEQASSRVGRHLKSATAFLTEGIAIMDLQRKVRRDMKEKDLTPLQATRIEERRIAIQKRVRSFRKLQRDFMPALDDFLEDNVDPTAMDAPSTEDEQLWLPSQLEDHDRDIFYLDGMSAKEALLLEACCHDALDKIRGLQRTKKHFATFKRRNLRGQVMNTRATASLQAVDAKISLHADKYRDCREALLRLRGREGDWIEVLRELKEADLTPPPVFTIDLPTTGTATMRQIGQGLGHGYATIPWIWSMSGVLGSGKDSDLNKALRVEWAKARARKLRWAEEVVLLKEEMRRVREALSWKAEWWRGKQGGWEGLKAEEGEGIAAYAKRQAAVYSDLLHHFTFLWGTPVQPLQIVAADERTRQPQSLSAASLPTTTSPSLLQQSPTGDPFWDGPNHAVNAAGDAAANRMDETLYPRDDEPRADDDESDDDVEEPGSPGLHPDEE